MPRPSPRRLSGSRGLRPTIAGQLDEPVRVAPLVVVPGVDLRLGAGDDHRRERVDDRRTRVVHVVDADERPLLVAEDAGERALGRRAQQAVDLLDRRLAGELEDAVGQRGVQQRDAHGVPVEPALQLREDQPDRGGRARGRRDQRHPGRPCPAQILVRCVDDRLRVREVVERRDRAVADPDPLVQHLDDRRQAVRRARRCGHDRVSCGVVAVVVDADDDVQRRAVLHRSGDDDLADAALEERRRASARTGTCPSTRARRRRRAAAQSTPAGSEASDQPSRRPSTVSDSVVAAHGRRPASVHRVELEQVGTRPRAALDLVDVNELEIVAAPAGPQREASHPTEAVDPDPDCRAHAGTSTPEPEISIAR